MLRTQAQWEDARPKMCREMKRDGSFEKSLDRAEKWWRWIFRSLVREVHELRRVGALPDYWSKVHLFEEAQRRAFEAVSWPDEEIEPTLSGWLPGLEEAASRGGVRWKNPSPAEKQAARRLTFLGWRAVAQWQLARPTLCLELRQDGEFYQRIEREGRRANEILGKALEEGQKEGLTGQEELLPGDGAGGAGPVPAGGGGAAGPGRPDDRRLPGLRRATLAGPKASLNGVGTGAPVLSPESPLVFKTQAGHTSRGMGLRGWAWRRPIGQDRRLEELFHEARHPVLRRLPGVDEAVGR